MGFRVHSRGSLVDTTRVGIAFLSGLLMVAASAPGGHASMRSAIPAMPSDMWADSMTTVMSGGKILKIYDSQDGSAEGVDKDSPCHAAAIYTTGFYDPCGLNPDTTVACGSVTFTSGDCDGDGFSQNRIAQLMQGFVDGGGGGYFEPVHPEAEWAWALMDDPTRHRRSGYFMNDGVVVRSRLRSGDLPVGQTYPYRCLMCNEGEFGNYLCTYVRGTLRVDPWTITGVSATVPGGSSAHAVITWPSPSPDPNRLTHIQIRRREGVPITYANRDTATTICDSLGPNAGSFVDLTGDRSKTYNYAILGFDRKGRTVLISNNATAGPPTNTFALIGPADGSVLTSRRPHFEWEAIPDASYILWYGTDSTFIDHIEVADLTSSSFDPPVDLNDNTTYYWKVAARGFPSVGACCQPNGSCAVTLEADCAGAWRGGGTVCSPNPCLVPLADGSIVTWGANDYGQQNVPAPNGGFTAASGGWIHSLGLRADSSIAAWGSNAEGQCVVPAPNTGFVAVAAGGYHSLGLKAGGSIVAWGLNENGQCTVPSPNSDFVAIAAGYYFSMGLKTDGSIVVWGVDGDGQQTVPEPNFGFSVIAAGGWHCVGRRGDGSITAWGRNDYGQCTVPDPNESFAQIAAGYAHSIGLRTDGSLVGWGQNDFGQATPPSPNSDFLDVACGGYHSLGLRADSSVVAWGWNQSGDCEVPAINAGFVAIGGGFRHSLGLRAFPTTGACCRSDGSCSLTDPGDCHAPDVWHGLGVGCAPNPCFGGEVTWSTQTEWRFGINETDQPPATFALEDPPDGATVGHLRPVLKWQASVDPGDNVRYTLYVASDPAFSSPIVVDEIASNSCISPDSLRQNTAYYWKVKASDSGGAETWGIGSGRMFMTDIDDQPTVFSRIYPREGLLHEDNLSLGESNLVTGLRPTFDWEDSIDPDGGPITYELRYDTTAALTEATVVTDLTSSDFTPSMDLLENQFYYWTVTAVDQDGDRRDPRGMVWPFVTNELNEPPSPFDLLQPENDAVLGYTYGGTGNHFLWEGNGDPDPYDAVRYDLMIGKDPGLQTCGVRHVVVDGTPIAPLPPHWTRGPTNQSTGNAWFCSEGGAGFYGDNWLDRLLSPTIDLTDASGPVTLSFQQMYSTEGPDWDGAVVRVSRDDALSFEVIYPTTGAYDTDSLWAFVYNGEGGATPAFCGESGDWHPVSFDLSPFTGDSIRLEFLFASDEFTPNPRFGWAIDDIDVSDATRTYLSDDGDSVTAAFQAISGPLGEYYWKVVGRDWQENAMGGVTACGGSARHLTISLQAPTGACCQPDGDCTVVSQADCGVPGYWSGPETGCTPNPCPPPPSGACCGPTGECEVTTETNCDSPNNWQGEGVVCLPNPCPTVPADGSIVTWGSNAYGQQDVPIPNAAFTAISSGWVHSLGLRADSSIAAWGSDDWGQCMTPTPNIGFVAVAAGGYHSLGLKAGGSVIAWGLNGDGQCAVPSPNADFVAIAAGYFFSMGLKTDGSIVVWGYNGEGQQTVPEPNSEFVGIAAGGWHCLGRRLDGSIAAWGRNDYGQCAVPDPNGDFVRIAAGYGHSFGLKADSSLVGWGRNESGQANPPSANSGFLDVACGAYHSLGLQTDGSVLAWGSNQAGNCDVPAPNAGFVAIGGGFLHSLGLRAFPSAGACCSPDGLCTVTIQSACVVPDAWQGLSTTCAPNPCGPTGACCFPDQTCSVLTWAQCVDQGGLAYIGDGTACEPDPCGMSGVGGTRLATTTTLRTAPNPFLGGTTLYLSGPPTAEARVLIFNAAGRLVRKAWEGRPDGREEAISWDGRDQSGRDVPAGIYLVRVQSTAGGAMGRLVKVR